MLGTKTLEPQLFTYSINLDQRVPANHPLREFRRVLGDLSWIRHEVAHFYGRNGNRSADPIVLVKMMLLLFLDDIPSERELMTQLPVRLDYLWFLDFSLDDKIPDHSVLSKARARWGSELFRKLFVRVLSTCVEAGLVDGRKLHLDSTLVRADVAKDSIVEVQPEVLAALRQAYQAQEQKLEQGFAPAAAQSNNGPDSPAEPPTASTPNHPQDTAAQAVVLLAPAPLAEKPAESQIAIPTTGVNANHLCQSDPDATLTRKGSGVAEPCYKQHRAIDDAHGVITAVQTTTGIVADGSQLPHLIRQHERNIGKAVQAVVGDKHYGTSENYRFCQSLDIATHLAQYEGNMAERGLMTVDQFTYEEPFDRYRCPQGHYLYYHNFKKDDLLVEYRIEDAKFCAECPLRAKCTKAKPGRSVTRPIFQTLVQEGREQAKSVTGKRSRRRRQSLMEGSFAESANNYGLKRSRWRRLWRQQIQDLLITTVQNLKILIRTKRRAHGGEGVGVAVVDQVAKVVGKSIRKTPFSLGKMVERLFGNLPSLTSNRLLSGGSGKMIVATRTPSSFC
jgi:transposase